MFKLSVISLGTALMLSATAFGCGPGKEANTPDPPAPTEPSVPTMPDVADAPDVDTPEDVSDAPADAPAAATTAKDVIDAYFAAVEAGDKDAAHALLTGKELEGAKSSKKSFTYVFFEMGFKVKTWKLKSDVEESGDEAKGRVKAVLIDAKGKDDNEGMRFSLVRKDGSWLIAEIN